LVTSCSTLACPVFLRHVDLPLFPTRRSSDLITLAQLSRLLVSVRRTETELLRARGASVTTLTVMALGEFAAVVVPAGAAGAAARSEEHTSELQSRENLVCRPLLETKKRRREK